VGGGLALLDPLLRGPTLVVEVADGPVRSRERGYDETLHWFETEVLTEERNFQGLVRLNIDLVQHEATRRCTRRVILGSCAPYGDR